MIVMLSLFYFITFIFFGTTAEVVKDPTLCGRVKCQVTIDQKFKYQEKVFYQYRYQINGSTNFGEKIWHNNDSRLNIDANIILHFSTPCEGSIRFGNVSISHDRSSYQTDFPDRAGTEFKNTLEHKILRFAFDDGSIRELCPAPDDEIWSLNLRRGVLSMLQNTMLRFDIDRRHDELDVNGVCETRYQLYEARHTSLIVHKNKNLATCRYSARHLSLIQSQSYRSPLSRTYELRQPFIISNSRCEITIDHNIYQRVECSETHQLRPLSNGENAGARAEIVSTLELISESYDNPQKDEENLDEGFVHSKRTNLLYDHENSIRTIYGELRAARDLLKSMCMLGPVQDLHENFSEVYTKFIHSARMLDYQGLLQLFHRAQGICKTGRKHIINALPYIGSNAAVSVMKDLIIKNYVDEDRINFWVTTFSLIPRPDRQTIYALAPLLDHQQKITESQFVLSYSSIIHTYCNNNNKINCANLEPIKKFMKLLESTVEKGCLPRIHSRMYIKQVLEALKAIGNAGVETETLLKTLKNCIMERSGFISIEVKVAAIEAHRRLLPCEKTRDKYFLSMYRNSTIDTEIRIASYLQVMKCPDYNTIKIIRQTLREEEINQVGSFVWSHLKNMLTSSSPSRIEIQSLLSDRDLGNKFNSDFRKFSRNYENSFFSEEYNIGVNYQSNLIFSPKSYIPRTLSLNLTFDLFGESVNVFDINIRAEGLEYYAENIFGPGGSLSGVKLADHFRQFLRHFRSTKEQDNIKSYWSKVKSLPNVINNDFEHPRVSLSYKIFGNEIKFIMLNSDVEIRNTLSHLNPWQKIQQILSGREIMHYENTAMFLDSSYVIPTSTGLPIRFDISGSTAYNIKLSGILNSQKFITDGELYMNGNIMPSFSADVTGRITMDAFYKSAGIKLKTSMYSVTAVDADVVVKSLKLIRLNWRLPNRKMEILSFTSNVLAITTNGAESTEKPVNVLFSTIKGIERNSGNHNKINTKIIKNTTCSWSALDHLIGLKLCADYQFPNVTKDANASYFLLNGPTNFKLSFIKADPTADSYLLEYKWKRTENESTIRFAFDTPGSQTQREISASLSFDVHRNNVTLLLKSKGNSLVAQGTYKRTSDETYINIGLDSHGTKHLDASIGYSKKNFKYGHSFSPKLYLAINNERILNLSGVIKNQDKMNTSQCDIDIRFETKNLSSHAFGYVLNGNASISGNIKIEYRFYEKIKNEILQTEFSLINRSSKTMTYKAADMKLYSTAYSQLNIVAGLRYQHALGHLELQLEVNTSPHLHNAEKHKLTAQFVATYSKPYFQSDGSNINIYLAVTKPAQDIDLKLGVSYYSIGPESKTRFLIRYAPSKEITLTINVVTPRGTLFIIEGHANLTIPNFNSMVISAKITERLRNEYDLNFSGTWFSGHNLSAQGTYYDRSSVAVTNNDLKILLKSPSFLNDILWNCNLYHDAADLRIGLFAEQIDADKYALIVNYTILSIEHFCLFVEGRFKNNSYSIMSNINLSSEASLKLHLDKWRDVHIIITSINERMNKEYGLVFQWDVNRDPSLKFITNIRLDKFVTEKKEKNISAIIYVSYPYRLIKGSCFFALKSQNNYVLDAFLEWNINQLIKFTVDTDYDTQNWIKKLKFESQLLTPFDNWRKTSVNGKYLQTGTTLIAGGSVYWQDLHYLIFDAAGKIKIFDNISEINVNCGIISTVHSIQYIKVNLTHNHVCTKSADSHIIIKYYPEKTIDIRNIWLVEHSNNNIFNISGNFQLLSPMINYRKCELKCYFSLMSNYNLYGAANLDLDKRKYTSHLIGDLTRMKESMVQFNITTPFENYSFIRGRFGLSEKKKHIVAEVEIPAGPLGIEGICQIFTNGYDFNVKLLIATPIDILQQALLVAKLNQQEADFRIAYNNLTTGFQGIWFYHNISNFHYSYILYTPLHGFQEIGLITKFIALKKEPTNLSDIDIEFSLRVVDLKVGVKIVAGPQLPPPLITFNIKQDTKVFKNDYQQELYDDIDHDSDNLYWKSEIEINAVIVETITGSLHFDREGVSNKILGMLKIPSGVILLEDNFVFEDLFHIKNDLSIDTPFQQASEIISVCSFNTNMEITILDFSFNVKNFSTWLETGINVNYTYQVIEETEPQLRLFKFNIRTPLQFLKFINAKTAFEVDENYYKMNVSVESIQNMLDFFGYLEYDTCYFDVLTEISVESPLIIIPKTKLKLKKDFNDNEKHLEFMIHIVKPYSKLGRFQANWLVEDKHLTKASVICITWLEPLSYLETSFISNNSLDLDKSMNVEIYLRHNEDKKYKLSVRINDSNVQADLNLPLQSRYFLFNGNFLKINNNIYELKGNIRNEKNVNVYDLTCPIKIERGKISSLNITISPITSANSIMQEPITLRFETEKFFLQIKGNYNEINGSVIMNFINLFNWDMQVKLYNQSIETFNFTIFMNVQVNGNTTLYLQTKTPWKEIEKMLFNGNLLLNGKTGNIHINHKLNNDSSHISFLYRLFYFTDMYTKLTIEHKKMEVNQKNMNAVLFFTNPKRIYRNINVGFDINVEDNWNFGTNVTIGITDRNNVDFILHLKSPPPNEERHNLLVGYTNSGYNNISYIIGYSTDITKLNYASDGLIKIDPRIINGQFRFTWGTEENKTLNNLFTSSFTNQGFNLKYSLFTPKYLDQETLIVLAKYKTQMEDNTLINTDIFCPGKKHLGSALISYKDIANINGTINATAFMPSLINIESKFVVFTNATKNKRFLLFNWINNSALFDSQYVYNSENLSSDLNGYVHVDFPLNTRHTAYITYGYNKKTLTTSGYSKLVYNDGKIIESLYKSQSESRAGFEKDKIDITIENQFRPIGIVYVNQYEYSGGNLGTNYPTIEYKQVNIYQLNNVSAFNISGFSKIRTRHTGQEIELTAVHSNRTVQFRTNYDVLYGEFKQTSWFSLAPDAWISYNIRIINRTTENNENQLIVLNLIYPQRNFTFNGSYYITNSALNSDISLVWNDNKEPMKTVGASFQWTNITLKNSFDQQKTLLSFKHPSFKKDIEFIGILTCKDIHDLLNISLIIDYSMKKDKLLVLSAVLRNESKLPFSRNYSYNMVIAHPKTQLNLNIGGYLENHKKLMMLKTINSAQYKRSFLPEETGKLMGRVDLSKHEIEFNQLSNEKVKHFYTKYDSNYPEYTVNGSMNNRREVNTTGSFFINFQDKFITMMINYTPDAIESLRMHGNIPDARNAYFKIWRTYDKDLSVSDLSFYVRLNHSRLVTSSLRWRPELKSDIINTIRSFLSNSYEELVKDIEYWRHYIRSETLSVVSDIWIDAQDEAELFLNDLNNLKVIQEDFTNLKIYLNDSYNANDFYIKDIVVMGVYIVDELSLRSHFQSLPNIISEVWEIMGESGDAIRNSLLWIIETIKHAYQKLSEIITAILRGDSMHQIADIFEKLIIKYDMLVKELHVSFIKYIECIYNKIYHSLSLQWHRFLMQIEPIFIKLAHYLETVGWKAVQEFFNFLYDREIELITSPYYDHFSNFTQDIDKFYRDVKANDIVTNIQKYSTSIIQFIKERYFAFVPFGKELKNVVDEIIQELKELQKLPSVKYTYEKIQQIYNRSIYIFNYFEVQTKLENTLRLIHLKIMDISQTALEAESRYRSAKTKFIYDSSHGLMCLEQKLPMSWHAFNQTPEFQEIPEYRAIVDMGSYFTASNTTFWTLYYRIKPLTEPSNWLPPFKAKAMIIGSQNFKTFDGRYFNFAGICTYLIARDFIQDHFAILIDYKKTDNLLLSHQIIVLVGNNAIQLDVFKNSVQLLGQNISLQLPTELDNGRVYVYQEENIVTIESKNQQFKLECNLKYDLCMLELAGWYYGKTAGLFGTINNERADDTLSSQGNVELDIDKFAYSWSIDKDLKCNDKNNLTALRNLLVSSIDPFCKELFTNKSSEFSSCFNVVDPTAYSVMCSNSLSNHEICGVAMSYLQTCMFYDTYLRIPDKCTICKMDDSENSDVLEGEFRKLEGKTVPQSTDVIFIVEAKECNREIRKNINIDQLIASINKELLENELIDNRWALVVFGGDGVINKPRSLILDNYIFTYNYTRFADYFDHIPVGSGSEDIFEAIRFASQLVFRAGVSKTFILLPCSHCEIEKQTLDYSVLYHALQERNIKLHILMDNKFQFERGRINRIFYGFDATKSYTKKDSRILNGDIELRRQVKLSKTALGYCTPLALETNGTIFNGSKLRSYEKFSAVKKFSNVFAKRLALTARPNSCQICECIATNDGLTKMECAPCDYPMPVTVDFVSETFNEDDVMTLQSLDNDYGQIDTDEE